MTDTPKGALELLEQLRQERDELDTLIRGLEKRMGIVSESKESESTGTTAKASVSLKSIPVGFFHNMSQADATDKLLRLNPGQPLRTKEILDAFRKSGMTVNPKNALTILYTTLKRSSRFERVAGQAWGLSEWYPDKKRKREEGQDEAE
jgi:HB1/ASXL restriction endonuclease-like protein with HTH domain